VRCHRLVSVNGLFNEQAVQETWLDERTDAMAGYDVSVVQELLPGLLRDVRRKLLVHSLDFLRQGRKVELLVWLSH
jgi:hypothetical protein